MSVSSQAGLHLVPLAEPVEQSCYHCGLPADPKFQASVQGEPRQFCCVGCQAVTQSIAGLGLADFYRFRDQPSQKANQQEGGFGLFDDPDIKQDFVRPVEEDLQVARLYLSGITCAACVWLIEQHLEQLPGVQTVRVNAANHQASVWFHPSQLAVSRLFQHLADIGFNAQPLLVQQQRQHWQAQQKQYLLRLGVAGVGMMQVGMYAIALYAGAMQGMDPQWEALLRWVSLMVTTPVIFFSASPFFSAAWRSLRTRHLVMDVPVAIALAMAYGASVVATVFSIGEVYFDSVSMFTFLLLLGRYLEQRARYRNFQATASYAQLLPLTVDKRENGQSTLVPLKHIEVGDQIWVGPGSVFPCDAQVLEGHSEAVEALLTGEANPVKKAPGDPVIGGTYNGSTGLLLAVTAVGRDTQLAAVEQMVEQAENSRPRQVTLADKVARMFVARVLLISVLVTGIWLMIDPSKAFWVTLSVLVVTCPCALGLATPTALNAAVNRLRGWGILVTSGQVLEALAEVDQVVMDKTGTLTQGRLRITRVDSLAQEWSEQHILRVAAALEAGSSHPIAQAFNDVAQPPPVEERKTKLGAGVSGLIGKREFRLGMPDFAFPQQPPDYPSAGQWLLLAEAQRPLAWIQLADSLRPGAAECIAQLNAAGYGVQLLSGDRLENVRSTAEKLGIKGYASGQLPGDKLDKVRGLQAEGKRVLMVGDGINDVPVLTGANVSLAMGSATRLAQTKADCILVAEDLRQLPRLLLMAKLTRRKIKQNIAWALGYNLTALPIAAMGLVPPWMAAIGMSASSLIVVLNALSVGRRLEESGGNPLVRASRK